jgi:lycopene beta-cyclase
MRFFYVLPFSERQALVEYIRFSPGEYDQAIRVYIETVLGIRDYCIVAKESGIIPLTDQPFPRQAGQRVMTIGTLGGRIKPSSGYAFLRIQQDSAAIVRSLLRVNHPFDVPPDSERYRLYDSGLLQVIHHHGEQIKPIFATLVRKNPIERVFRFLDGTASLWEDLVLMASLPPGPFLRALFRSKVLRRV